MNISLLDFTSISTIIFLTEKYKTQLVTVTYLYSKLQKYKVPNFIIVTHEKIKKVLTWATSNPQLCQNETNHLYYITST